MRFKNFLMTAINAMLRRLSARLELVYLRAFQAQRLLNISLVFLIISLSACVSREKIDAIVWEESLPLPADICASNPDLMKYGHYRKMNGGGFELFNFCNPVAPPMICMTKDDYEKLWSGTVPKP